MTSRTDSAHPHAVITRPMRRRRLPRVLRIAALAVISMVLIGTTLEPANAASKPGKVGLVSFVAKSYSNSKNTASLKVSWPKARRTKKYEVFISRKYSMSDARKYTTGNRYKNITGLAPGIDYFIQVRGVNGSKRGEKSNRVGHRTLGQLDVARGATYRIMTYNVCSRVCSKWSTRHDPAQSRIQTYKPDVLMAQEADNLGVPVGYTLAHYKSAKLLAYKSSRFTMEPPAQEATVLPTVDTKERCSTPTRTWGSAGEIVLGYHGGGCRFAVWAILSDVQTGARTMFVNVHTVSGDNTTDAKYRKYEIRELLRQIQAEQLAQGIEDMPVIYGGDFNSHKNRSNDYLATEFHNAGYIDAYDLALTLRLQHNNSFNDFKTTPKISYKWGDHVDKIWLRPDQGRVLKWNNGALISGGKMVTPIPSDHSPIMADVRIN